MKYGENGESFILDGKEVKVDIAFLLSTVMAMMLVMRERMPVRDEEEPMEIFDVVEYLASRIYETITQNESENSGESTGTAQG
jgi:hypothetical protein